MSKSQLIEGHVVDEQGSRFWLHADYKVFKVAYLSGNSLFMVADSEEIIRDHLARRGDSLEILTIEQVADHMVFVPRAHHMPVSALELGWPRVERRGNGSYYLPE